MLTIRQRVLASLIRNHCLELARRKDDIGFIEELRKSGLSYVRCGDVPHLVNFKFLLVALVPAPIARGSQARSRFTFELYSDLGEGLLAR